MKYEITDSVEIARLMSEESDSIVDSVVNAALGNKTDTSKSKEQEAEVVAAVLVMAINGLCEGDNERLYALIEKLCVNRKINFDQCNVYKWLMINGIS